MMDHHFADRELTRRLLAHDDREVGLSSPVAGAQREGFTLMEVLLARQDAIERRVRLAAVAAWCAVLVIAPLFGIAIYGATAGSTQLQEKGGRAAMFVLGVLGVLAIALALTMTATWLLRTRTASLAAVERRLASLEASLTRER